MGAVAGQSWVGEEGIEAAEVAVAVESFALVVDEPDAVGREQLLGQLGQLFGRGTGFPFLLAVLASRPASARCRWRW